MIIFLNGASSVGKSTIARQILHESQRPFVYFSIDHLVNRWMDEKFIAFDIEPDEWLYQEKDIGDEGNLLAKQAQSPNVAQLHWDLIEALTVLIDKGYDLVIDEVLSQIEIFQRYTHALAHSKKVYMVKIICDLMECERREKNRQDRFKGFARAIYSQTYAKHPYYDVEIDTTSDSPEVCAKKIIQYVNNHPKPQAFNRSLQEMIAFVPLTADHFETIAYWINLPHIAPWWGENKSWTVQDIAQKYGSYTTGYKLIGDGQKPIYSYIIQCAKRPIGYIQYYRAQDFPREGYHLNVKGNLAALDLYIGDPHYIGRGLGAHVIDKFLSLHIWPQFEFCLLDPQAHNMQAIRAYQKAGFKIVQEIKNPPTTLMLKQRPLDYQKLSESHHYIEE